MELISKLLHTSFNTSSYNYLYKTMIVRVGKFKILLKQHTLSSYIVNHITY